MSNANTSGNGHADRQEVHGLASAPAAKAAEEARADTESCPLSTNGRHFHALGKNVLLKYAAETSRLFQMAFFVVVARVSGAGALGTLTLLIATGSLVALVTGDLGLNTTTIAKMSGGCDRERGEIASEALSWKAALSVVALLLICGALYLTRSTGSWAEILAAAVISLGSVWLEFLCALTNGLNRLDVEVWIRIAYRGVVYGGGTFVAFLGSLRTDLVFMAVAGVVVLSGALALIRRRLLREVRAVYRPSSEIHLLKESLPVWVTQLAQLSYLRFDIVILGLVHVATREIGWYAAAWKIADVLSVVPALLSGAALPLISGGATRSSVAVIAPRYLKLMYVLPFLFALPLAIGAGWITRSFYGPGFDGTPAVLRILVWAVIPIFVHTFLATLAVAVGRQSEAAKLAAGASILTVVGALLLVPRLGYEAMAAVSLVANALFACAMIYRFRNVTECSYYPVALKSLGSALAVYWICSSFLSAVPPLLLVVGAVVAYCATLLLLRVFSISQLNRGRRIFMSLLWRRNAIGEASAA